MWAKSVIFILVMLVTVSHHIGNRILQFIISKTGNYDSEQDSEHVSTSDCHTIVT